MPGAEAFDEKVRGLSAVVGELMDKKDICARPRAEVERGWEWMAP